MRTGPELTVVDVSPDGALVESPVRVVPGARLDVHLMTCNGRMLVRSRVVRSFVAKVQADALMYRAALLFDQTVDTRAYGYSVPPTLAGSDTETGMTYP